MFYNSINETSAVCAYQMGLLEAEFSTCSEEKTACEEVVQMMTREQFE